MMHLWLRGQAWDGVHRSPGQFAQQTKMMKIEPFHPLRTKYTLHYLL